MNTNIIINGDSAEMLRQIPAETVHCCVTSPPKLAETCILAGCPAGGIVLDPFFGSGTTRLVAKQTGRQYIGIDINAEYCRLADERINGGVKGGK